MLNRFTSWRSLHLPPILWFRLANHAQRRGQLTQAIAYFEQFLSRCPQQTYAWQRLVDLYTMVGQLPEAAERCRRWLESDPNSIAAWQKLGQILFAQDNIWAALTAFKTGLMHYQSAVGQQTGGASPTSLAIAIAASADHLRHRHQWQAAAYAYQLALRIHMDRGDWHRYRLQALLELQDWPGAIAAAKAVIALDPTCTLAYYGIGQAASQQQDWPLAALAYGQAIALGHTSPWAWVHWAEALAAQARWIEAAEAYRQACNCCATQPLPARIYQNQAQILERLSDWPALLHHSQRAIAHYPHDIALWRSLALAHHRSDHREAAIATYQQVLQRSPSPWLHNTLARLLLQTGNLDPDHFDAARHHYDRAIAQKTDWEATFYQTWGATWAKVARTALPPQRDIAWGQAIAATQAALAQGLAHADQIRAYVLLSQGHQSQGDWEAAIAPQQQAYQLVTTAPQPQLPEQGTAAQPPSDRWRSTTINPCQFTAPALGLGLADLWMQVEQPRQAAPLYWQYLPGSRPTIPGYGIVTWPTWHRAIAALAHVPAAATAMARQALLLAPTDPVRQLQLAECLVTQQAFTSATPIYRHLLEQRQTTHDPNVAPNPPDRTDAALSPPIDRPKPTSNRVVSLDRGDLLRRLATAAWAGWQWTLASQSYQQLLDLGIALTATEYQAWGKATEATEDWDQAIACYTQATQAFPQELDFYTRLGDIYRNKNHFLAAAQTYEQAIQQHPQAPESMYLDWCNAWQKTGRLSSLAAALHTSIQRHPLNAQFRAQLGRLYLRQGQVSRAVTALWQTIALDPDHPDANLELVRQLFNLNAGEVAVAVYAQASERGLRLPAYLHRQCADWLIAQDPQNPDSYAQAQTILERAIAQHPNHGRLRGALGMVLAQRGDQTGAIAAFEAGLALEPEAASLHQAWGDYWQHWGGDPDKAQDCYQKARSLDPDLLPETASSSPDDAR